ncbi:hypothetical protein M885DRAFT_502875 [Pelagophyceae sp. CCMP2097]|nr:hypothetical protein M885DRAFT_502875 [Pelagophyceae sp. CCMP2097]|eukprot:CAMPEP_0206821722 /NCGR_PEP_ID=MMETSP0975-20121206/12462_1 /ASSEMBLY_ACC=CAM_ASM_000399 /TAXON_ID=483370 /ORGANISM="non described non described, Strain CCMP2097" /LENGTH=617 /DNA_ID=CAMNT_0054363969 /DNA_START=13 /DNA_END=1866 /DNA_ORIENTATION=+
MAAATAAAALPAGSSDLIIIHVCDEARQINRDFACDRQILLEEMKYFRSYLGGDSGSFDDIDISVHCDVHIFEWLVQWIHSPLRPPPLDSSSVVSILISSEFLEMDRLVEHCLHFMASNIEEILRMPIDLACVSDALVTRLAGLCTADVLSALRDDHDKLLPKLYKRRLEIDFRHRDTAHGRARARALSKTDGADLPNDVLADAPRVLRCVHCAKLYPEWAQRFLGCGTAPALVDRRGQLVSRHAAVAGERWSLTEHVAALHAAGMGWDEIYWLMWGVTHVFRCRACQRWFAADDGAGCAFHTADAAFAGASGAGEYPCCGRRVLRFSPYAPVPGCATRDHDIDAGQGSATTLSLRLLRRQGRAISDAAARAKHGGKKPADAPALKDEAAPAADDFAKPPADAGEAATEDDETREPKAAKRATIRKLAADKDKAATKAKKSSDRARNRAGASSSLPAFDGVSDAADRPAADDAPARPRDGAPPNHSVFGAAPLYEAEFARRAEDEHPLTKQPPETARDAKERRDHAQLSPKRRRAREIDCIWRERDEGAMQHLSRILIQRRNAWSGLLTGFVAPNAYTAPPQSAIRPEAPLNASGKGKDAKEANPAEKREPSARRWR